MTQSVLSIATAVRDHCARTSLEEMIRTMNGVAEATRTSGPDILIFEVEPGKEREFLEMHRALLAQVQGEIFLVCAKPSPKFLILAMRSGIQEVLPMPPTRQDLSRALARYRDRAASTVAVDEGPGKGKVIGVLAARPGVGATTLAVNLAAELQRTAPTAIMDMAVPMGEVPLFLDLEYTYTWGEVAQHVSRLDATYLRGVMPRHASGLSLLASPGDVPVADAAQAMPPIMEQLRKSFDHTVIDADPMLSATNLKELEKADEIILVVNLNLPCLAHAQRASDLLRSLESSGSRIRVAANRFLKQGDIQPAEAEEVLERKIDWLIAEDSNIIGAVNQGLTLAEAAPKSPVTKSVRTMALDLAGASAKAARSTGRTGLGSLFRRNKGADMNIRGAEAV